MINIDMNRTELTDKDLKIGVWNYGEEIAPAQSFNEFAFEVYDDDRIWINVGAWTGLPEKEFKKHKAIWLKVLPTLKNVRFLWIKGSVNQEIFEAICKMDWLEALNIQGLISIKNLDSIANLKNLIHFNIGNASKLEDISGLCSLKNLVTLQFEGFRLIKDITPITKIKSLKGLCIRGEIWKKQYIHSIEGIDELTNLEYFSLDGTEVLLKDISPIIALQKLRSLEMGYWWTEEDFQLLYQSLPDLKYGDVKEVVESGEYEQYLMKKLKQPVI